MAIFSKPISQLSTEDLQESLAERAVENVRLEFKAEIPGKDETLKKLSSFANTFGGYLVVGAKADSTDGRLAEFPGVEPQAGFKQRNVQWCFESVSPPLTVEVSDPIPVPAQSGRVAYVLYVPESDLAPHFLAGRKGIYVRTDEFSPRFEPRLATQAELQQLFDRRKVVVTRRDDLICRARERFDTFVRTRYSEFAENQRGIGARFSLSIVPRYPSRQLWSQAKLLQLLKTKRVPWQQVDFPRDNQGIITQHESVLFLHPGSNFSIFEANTWGLLFYAVEIEEETSSYKGIHLNCFLGHLLVFLEYTCLIVREAQLAGPLEITMALDAIHRVPWIYFSFNRPEEEPGSELDDAASFGISTTAEELVRRRDGIMMDLLTFVFFATNSPTIAQYRQRLRELVKAGYHYNYWPAPDALQE